MDIKILNLILLIVWICATENSASTFEPIGNSSKDKVTRTVWKNKSGDDNEDYLFNKGYSSTYNSKDDRTKEGPRHESYKDDEKIISKYHPMGRKLKQGNYHDGRGIGYNDDGYNHKYRHGYHHSHDYHRHRHHRLGDKDQDEDKNKYGGYHRVRVVHNREEKSNKHNRCKNGDCKYGGYRYDDEFEYQYGNDGNDYDKHDYDVGSHDRYKDNTEYNRKHALDHEHNEDIDDHMPGHHYVYAQSEDYPSFASYHHYRHRELDHDHADHRHELVPRNY